MKRILFVLIATTMCATLFAQSRKSARVNVIFNPLTQVVAMDNNIGVVGEFGAELTFNDNFFVGGSIAKTINSAVFRFDDAADPNFRFAFTQMAVALGGYYQVETKRSKLKRNTNHLNFSVRLGGGRAFMRRIEDKGKTFNDYFISIEPRLAFDHQMNDIMAFSFGASYKLFNKMNQLVDFVTPDDVSGPCVHIGLRFKLFPPYKL